MIKRWTIPKDRYFVHLPYLKGTTLSALEDDNILLDTIRNPDGSSRYRTPHLYTVDNPPTSTSADTGTLYGNALLDQKTTIPGVYHIKVVRLGSFCAVKVYLCLWNYGRLGAGVWPSDGAMSDKEPSLPANYQIKYSTIDGWAEGDSIDAFADETITTVTSDELDYENANAHALYCYPQTLEGHEGQGAVVEVGAADGTYNGPTITAYHGRNNPDRKSVVRFKYDGGPGRTPANWNTTTTTSTSSSSSSSTTN